MELSEVIMRKASYFWDYCLMLCLVPELLDVILIAKRVD